MHVGQRRRRSVSLSRSSCSWPLLSTLPETQFKGILDQVYLFFPSFKRHGNHIKPGRNVFQFSADHVFEGYLGDLMPFPSIDTLLGKAEGNGEMFCSQLVALTFQRAGLLSLEHPPNFYSPNSFSMANPHLALLQGASFDAEVPIQMDEG